MSTRDDLIAKSERAQNLAWRAATDDNTAIVQAINALRLTILAAVTVEDEDDAA